LMLKQQPDQEQHTNGIGCGFAGKTPIRYGNRLIAKEERVRGGRPQYV
jgi:hypothetical protein